VYLRRREELRATCVGEPALVLVRRPAAVDDEQPPGVRVVERPEDVGRVVDVEICAKAAVLVDLLDDRALVSAVRR
jgi:hypothetical protein